MGLHVSHLLEPEYLTRVRKMIARTLDAQVQIIEKVQFLTKEGHNLLVSVAVHPIYRQGKAIEIQGLATTLNDLDVTDPQEARDFFSSGAEGLARPNTEIQFIYNSGTSNRKQRNDWTIAGVNRGIWQAGALTGALA